MIQSEGDTLISYKIVVARYNEDIRWLDFVKDNCIVYNKGDTLNVPNEIMRTNIGRESETYLNYIITNYDQLPDIVVFTQGNIADHLGSNDIRHLLMMAMEANTMGKSRTRYSHPIDKNLIDGTTIHWGPAWNFRPTQPGGYYLHNCYKNNKHILFYDWFIQNIRPEYPDVLHIYLNAIFAVKKELILKRPIEYYKKLIEEVNHHVNSVEGHFFERSWFYIFD
jgi:hypothetical protein